MASTATAPTAALVDYPPGFNPQVYAAIVALIADVNATQGGAFGQLRNVRNVVLTNTSLTAFTVAAATLNDNVAGGNVAGDRVLLVGQTDATQNGIYVVGTVATGTAPLTLAADWLAASVQPAGVEFNINAGTIFGGRTWFATLAGAITVGTSSPAFYPRRYSRVTTAMSGTPGIKALSAEWILSATTSIVTPVVIAPGTQGFLSRGTITSGFGNGAVTITSTANETSTLQVTIEN